jgi:hypothetical protein
MPLTLGFGRTFRPFGRYPTMAGGETSQANRSGSRRPQIRRKTTPGVANGRRLRSKPNRAPQTGARHQLTPSMPVLPLDPRRDRLKRPRAKTSTQHRSSPWARQTRCSEKNSRDRKDFLVATSKTPSSSSAPQGARRPPLPPGGGRLVSGSRNSRELRKGGSCGDVEVAGEGLADRAAILGHADELFELCLIDARYRTGDI